MGMRVSQGPSTPPRLGGPEMRPPSLRFRAGGRQTTPNGDQIVQPALPGPCASDRYALLSAWRLLPACGWT
ncbi:hypothetical protein Slala05_37430 [Streptomyces lavendulae subsp. lavendulae]|nr:hypothetical protein Slala05_37430 [Streptomyces lavendulae subsp. lavendulae]